MEKDTGSFEDIARNKLAQAIDDLESADILLGADKYRAANNRAYYACLLYTSPSPRDQA